MKRKFNGEVVNSRNEVERNLALADARQWVGRGSGETEEDCSEGEKQA